MGSDPITKFLRCGVGRQEEVVQVDDLGDGGGDAVEDRDESPLHTDGVSFEKKVLYRVTSAVAQVIYLNDHFLASDTAS